MWVANLTVVNQKEMAGQSETGKDREILDHFEEGKELRTRNSKRDGE